MRTDVDACCGRPVAASGAPTAVTVRSLGPLGLAGRQGSHRGALGGARAAGVPVAQAPAVAAGAAARARRPDGARWCAARAPSSTRCASTSLGDDVRSIDWRATARAADVMVRTWRPERDRRVRARPRHRAHVARRAIGDGTRLDAVDGRRAAARGARRPGRRPGRPARLRPRGPRRRPRRGRHRACCRSWSTRARRRSSPRSSRPTPAGWSPRCWRGCASARSSCCSPPLDRPALERGAAAGAAGADRPAHRGPRRRCANPSGSSDSPRSRGRGAVYDAAAAAPTCDRAATRPTVLARLGVEVVDADPADIAPAPRRPLPRPQGRRPPLSRCRTSRRGRTSGRAEHGRGPSARHRGQLGRPRRRW